MCDFIMDFKQVGDYRKNYRNINSVQYTFMHTIS